MEDKSALVIDSNVVLDWLFFAEPATLATINALLHTHRWVCTPWMMREAQRVATLPQLAKYANPQATQRLQQGFAAYATVIEPDNAKPPHAPSPIVTPLRCRDPDDQAFLDLALHTQAPLLLTLDRDLLKLRKRACVLGLNIVQPFKAGG